MKDFEYRDWLKAEMQERKQRNSSYSLRAFARDLKVGVTTLHDVLKGERHLSEKNLKKVSKSLQWSLAKCKLAEMQIRTEQRHSQQGPDEADRWVLEDDQEEIISDGVSFVLLNWIELCGSGFQLESTAEQLGLRKEELKNVLDRLERLGHLQKTDSGWVRLSPALGTTQDIPSVAIRRHHKKGLERAISALQTAPEEREIQTLTLKTSPQVMPELKVLLREFRDRMMELAETHQPNGVYQFSLQFFPVLKKQVYKENKK